MVLHQTGAGGPGKHCSADRPVVNKQPQALLASRQKAPAHPENRDGCTQLAAATRIKS